MCSRRPVETLWVCKFAGTVRCARDDNQARVLPARRGWSSGCGPDSFRGCAASRRGFNACVTGATARMSPNRTRKLRSTIGFPYPLACETDPRKWRVLLLPQTIGSINSFTILHIGQQFCIFAGHCVYLSIVIYIKSLNEKNTFRWFICQPEFLENPTFVDS